MMANWHSKKGYWSQQLLELLGSSVALSIDGVDIHIFPQDFRLIGVWGRQVQKGIRVILSIELPIYGRPEIGEGRLEVLVYKARLQVYFRPETANIHILIDPQDILRNHIKSSLAAGQVKHISLPMFQRLAEVRGYSSERHFKDVFTVLDADIKLPDNLKKLVGEYEKYLWSVKVDLVDHELYQMGFDWDKGYLSNEEFRELWRRLKVYDVFKRDTEQVVYDILRKEFDIGVKQ